jgi:glycosyltransferase involved in cell wall biosynthesis
MNIAIFPFSVSVIIPTYNQSKDLNRCLLSLVDQTFKNFEVIICDDGSFDDTKYIVEQYRSMLEITYLYNENFGGPAHPRNNGIKAAKGEYIAFLDSDDWWCNNKLEFSTEVLSLGYDFVYHDMYLVKDISEKPSKKLSFGSLTNSVFNQLLTEGNLFINSSVVLRSNILQKVGFFDEQKDLIASEDYDLWIRVSAVTNKFFRLSECLGYYWHGGNNISKNKLLSKAGKIILQKHINTVSPKIYNFSLGFMHYSDGLYLMRCESKLDACISFFRSIRLAKPIIKLKAIYRFFECLF